MSENHTLPDADACYAAHSARDAAADGRFFTAVSSTGIFCRPICPARTPKRENCLFLPSAAAALALGYRPCLRCRPEAAPGSGAWAGSAAVVQRGLRLIEDGALDAAGSVAILAGKLGMGERQLRRLFDRHLGASPKQIAVARRLGLARRLIRETSLPMTDVALAAGYGSLRRFNDAFRKAYAAPPSALKRASGGDTGLRLRLAAVPPFDGPGLLSWFAGRAAGGHEAGLADNSYARIFALEDGSAARLRLRADGDGLAVAVELANLAALPRLVALTNRQFGLGFHPAARNSALGADPLLAPLVTANPGLRLPLCPDPVEAAVRAILGQQVSVKAARTLCQRLVAQYGTRADLSAAQDGRALPDHIFPSAARLAAAPIHDIGLTRTRAATLHRLMQAVVTGDVCLTPSAEPASLRAQLLALKGIGPWTADYICLRALGAADSFPAADLGLIRAAASLGGPDEAKSLASYAETHWHPWRSHAALYLWSHAATPL